MTLAFCIPQWPLKSKLRRCRDPIALFGPQSLLSSTLQTHKHFGFLHCCHKTSVKSNISKSLYWLAFAGSSPPWQGWHGARGNWSHCVHSQDAGRNACCTFAAIFLSVQPRTLGRGRMLPTFGTPNLETPRWTCSQFCLLGRFRACPT